MGSSKRSPAPIPYGYGSYEQGTDSSGSGAVMPKGLMPDNYTPKTQIGQAWNGGTNGVLYGNSYGAGGISAGNMPQGNATPTATDFFNKTNYSPFFMRF